MKKFVLGMIVMSVIGCQSTTEVDVQAADSLVVKTVDSVKVINDSIVVDTLKKK